ncbi:MAG: capsule assembly Wzi family protein [Fulvivirga sp.]
MNKNINAFFILLIFLQASVFAQESDSLRITMGTTATMATSNYQPLWVESLQFGSISAQKVDLSTHFYLSNYHLFGKKGGTTSGKKIPEKRSFSVRYGIHLINNNHFRSLFAGEAYLKAGYKNWEIRAGRFREIIGEVDPDLSSGSLGVSGNALPIPKIGAAVTEYTDLPYTNGWLQFKGLMSHGWMGQNRYMRDAFLHEKTLYMRLGKGKLKLFGGVQHYAVWGGIRDNFPKLDRDLGGFMDVLLVKETDDGSLLEGQVREGTVPEGTYVPRPNKAGDHRGVIEGGFEWEGDNILIKAYHQTPFDMGIGISIKNIDKLAGLSIANKNPGLFRKGLIEFIHTRQMTDWVPHHRESYYNNGVYKTGWEYENLIIGTPLFTNRIRASSYFPEIEPYDWNAPNESIHGNDNVINNRVIGGHFGFILAPFSRITTRTILTLVRNYGPKRPFPPHKDQFYSLQEIIYQSPFRGLKVNASIAVDHGEMTKNIGGMLGIEWQIRSLTRN